MFILTTDRSLLTTHYYEYTHYSPYSLLTILTILTTHYTHYSLYTPLTYAGVCVSPPGGLPTASLPFSSLRSKVA